MKLQHYFNLVLFFLFFFISNSVLSAEVLNNKIKKLTLELRCMTCQNQSVYDSDSEFANSLKIVVDEKIKEGLSDKQIYDYFKEKYGDWILYDPGINKNTYFLWLLPLMIFLFGGTIIYKKLIKKI